MKTQPPQPQGRFAVYLLPAIIAQSMIMGGGYSTGREIVEYAARFGPRGWLSVLVIFIGFAVLSSLVYELARVGKAYDYKSWIQLLIGPLWPLFDILLITLMLFIMAVMMAAMGSILDSTLGVPRWLGLTFAFSVVGLLGWNGSAVLERFKTVGSVFLYGGYLSFATLVLLAPTPVITGTAEVLNANNTSTGEVVLKAVQYLGYNLTTFTAVLFCLHRQTTRKETVTAGLITGVAMTLPFALTFLSLMKFWPSQAVFGAEVPWLAMLESVAGETGSRFWIGAFAVVAGWTLLETATGAIHALVDRIERNLTDLPKFLRPAGGEFSPFQRLGVSVSVLGLSLGLAQFGVIDLVAKGYGAMSWAFLLLMALPLLTVGVWRIFSTPN